MPGVFRRPWRPRPKKRQTAFLNPLTGVRVSAQVGTVGFAITTNPDLTGVTASAQVGSAVASVSKTVSLTGIEVTTGFASTNIDNVQIPLTGLAAVSQWQNITHLFRLIGVSARAQAAVYSAALGGNDRVFFIAGVKQDVLPPGMQMYPTSDTYNVATTTPYIIGSSPAYTIAQVSWNNVVKTRDVDWQLVAPFTHIIKILDPAHVITPVQLIYGRWNIGVRAGFEVTAYPIPFSFLDTSILAEDIPAPGQYFTVNFTQNRMLSNPQSLFAIYPLIVDDMLTDHTLYDPPLGFQSYRPIGYQVFEISTLQIFTWDGVEWANTASPSNGIQFYVKRLRTIYEIVGSTVVSRYVAGSGLNPSYPQVIAYPPFGEGIGKNLLTDAFAPTAAVEFPAAYEVSLSPGDYDPWVVSV
jgi:hypothetical protein